MSVLQVHKVGTNGTVFLFFICNCQSLFEALSGETANLTKEGKIKAALHKGQPQKTEICTGAKIDVCIQSSEKENKT